MARVRLAPGVIDDLDRIVDHLLRHEAKAAQTRVAGIISALDVLEANPLIGWPAGEDRRELVIGRGAEDYVALYRYLPMLDVALVLAIRGQREAGYARA
ncbi:MAG: type II toxin-antitoxin system RelE/ParE family toxin [Xanthomonadales bacterium]|nr:type II toxin-antitoxin system RelE/ParE family toxin [Xanthomonadales bacterium]